MTPLSHIDPRTMPPAEAKSAWRSAVRHSRLQRGERRMGEHADSFRDQVLSLPEVEGIRCASIYASRAYEPGTLPLILALHERGVEVLMPLSLIHISEPTRLRRISYAVFCLK